MPDEYESSTDSLTGLKRLRRSWTKLPSNVTSWPFLSRCEGMEVSFVLTTKQFGGESNTRSEFSRRQSEAIVTEGLLTARVPHSTQLHVHSRDVETIPQHGGAHSTLNRRPRRSAVAAELTEEHVGAVTMILPANLLPLPAVRYGFLRRCWTHEHQ